MPVRPATTGIQTHEPARYRCMLWNHDHGNNGATWGLWCSPLPDNRFVVDAISNRPDLADLGRLSMTGEQLRNHAVDARRITSEGPPPGVAFLGR